MKHDPVQPVMATRYERRLLTCRQEVLADETPVAFVYNGTSHAVMMATPADLDDFAYGFTLSEGIVESRSEIEIIDRLHTDRGISLQMLIPQRRHDALNSHERNLTGRTGCGLCGTASLEAAIRPVRRVVMSGLVGPERLQEALCQMAASQPLNQASGAAHAAGLLLDDGQLLVREDVGRHNAVDKVIGAAAGLPATPKALLVTSRASYELVHKAAQMNCPVVAAISAPTAMAVRIAEEAGITLIGFARGERMTFYTGRNPVH